MKRSSFGILNERRDILIPSSLATFVTDSLLGGRSLRRMDSLARKGRTVMTYKIEPGLGRIMSPVVLLFPDGHTLSFSSGEEACRAVYNRKYRVVEMRAVENTIEIRLELTAVPEINAVGEETFF